MSTVGEAIAEEREREAWRLRMQGWTQQRIADHLGIAQSTVCEALQRIEKKLAEEFREQAAEIKARQTAQLEQLADELWQQWRRSCEDGVTETSVKGKTTGKAGVAGKSGEATGGKDESRAQVTRTVEGQSGNPSLVAQLRGAMADIRTIWGLDAPQKVDATTGGQPLGGEWVEIRTRILEALGAFPEARVMLAEVLTNGRR